MHGGQGYVCPYHCLLIRQRKKDLKLLSGKAIGSTPRRKYTYYINFRTGVRYKTVLMGFGLESDAIHSPNENFSLDIFRKGIEAVVEFHLIYGKK